ncbi:Cox20/FAM36A [Plasmopara halstedii]|uniref:Cytochrome c oxidase assembly protein COX20, mitochondrial n=1 Tax=Plasmopara halstedii TaxID=4781 RepID=A0A0P1AJ33_PLAHL|nr:Cox20/FAM36A [Plasmopara halstedii]CEG41364.1 Cox20/FAM36A [Plasmopara halstedii]|eukprot:XP_024577733.1 Cox20/FAM36A [Plasmopara halstedii]
MSSSDTILKNPPCFRSGLMWGITVASFIGAHRFRTTKSIRSSCDWAIGSFGLVSTCSWVFCSASYRLRARQTREFMEVMNNPTRKAEAEQFLRSRVQPRSSEDED